MDEEEPMVPAGVVIKELGIPRSTLHRLVLEGRIPAHETTQPWHRTRRWSFKLSEVRAALGEPPAPPRTRAGGHDAAPSNSPSGA